MWLNFNKMVFDIYSSPLHINTSSIVSQRVGELVHPFTHASINWSAHPCPPTSPVHSSHLRVHPHFRLSIHKAVRPSTRLAVHPRLRLSILRHVRPSVQSSSVRPSITACIHSSIHPSIHPPTSSSVHQQVLPPVQSPSVHPQVYPTFQVRLSIHSFHLSVPLFLHLSICTHL